MKHRKPEKFDFSGFITKYNVKCDDGRTIVDDAFAHHDGDKIPLVDNHQHKSIDNVIGNVILEHRSGEGLYGYASLNQTEKGKNAAIQVQHGDIDSFSIFANKLVQNGSRHVSHGQVREASLVLSGANPVAKIDNLILQHGYDHDVELDDEAIIHGFGIFDKDKVLSHSSISEEEDIVHNSAVDVYNTMTEDQKELVEYLISELNIELEQSGIEGEDNMKINPFEKKKIPEPSMEDQVMFHSALMECYKAASNNKTSFVEEVNKHEQLSHANVYGITNIEYLFPDAKMANNQPSIIDDDWDWVMTVINGVTKTPFSKVKSLAIDISMEEARAKGYIKGNEKTDVQYNVLTRTIDSTTVYARQKMDNDDLIDITDYNIWAMMKGYLRTKLYQELARAYLIGDGRKVDDVDKIKADKIVPIWTDEDQYTVKAVMDSSFTATQQIDEIIRKRKLWKGSGRPTLFVPQDVLTDWLLVRDEFKHRIYKTVADLAQELRVAAIVDIEQFEGKTRVVGSNTHTLFAMMVNLKDYNVGTNAGGKVKDYEFFDIDFNQHKYLMETRHSGGLVKPYSALVFETVKATPTPPAG